MLFLQAVSSILIDLVMIAVIQSLLRIDLKLYNVLATTGFKLNLMKSLDIENNHSFISIS